MYCQARILGLRLQSFACDEWVSKHDQRSLKVRAIVKTYFKSPAEMPISRMPKRHSYSSLIVSKSTPLRALQSRTSSTMCSHVQFGTLRVCTKKVSRCETL